MKTELGRTSVAEGAAERPRAATGVEILPAASGEDSYGLSLCFPQKASVGSSHNRPTSAEDHEEALLLGCPPIGRSDTRNIEQFGKEKKRVALYPRPKNAEALRPTW